jgi:hypothetical protein
MTAVQHFARVSPASPGLLGPALVIGPASQLRVETWAVDGGRTRNHTDVLLNAEQLRRAVGPDHQHCDGDPTECSVQALQGELAELRHQVRHLAALLGITLSVADTDPHAFDRTTGSGVRCLFCDAEPPGMALTLTRGQHRPGCTWVAACELVELLEADRDGATDAPTPC